MLLEKSKLRSAMLVLSDGLFFCLIHKSKFGLVYDIFRIFFCYPVFVFFFRLGICILIIRTNGLTCFCLRYQMNEDTKEKSVVLFPVIFLTLMILIPLHGFNHYNSLSMQTVKTTISTFSLDPTYSRKLVHWIVYLTNNQTLAVLIFPRSVIVNWNFGNLSSS